MPKARKIAIALSAAILALTAACGAVMTRSPANLIDATSGLDLATLRASPYERPLVVILADNAGSETTDLLVPFSVIKRSGVADVLIVSTGDGVVQLMPALQVNANMTIAEFEAARPAGADVVIVPAFHSGGTALTSAFLQRQAAKGAFVVSICEGAEAVAKAGLFEGRTATTHWFAQRRMARRYPDTVWVRNTRYIVDGPVMSSSGVSASLPISLALIDILAGRPAAGRTAAALGVTDWSSKHDSAAFHLGGGLIGKAGQNLLAVWGHEEIGVVLEDGFDSVAFALQADAWSRTYRSRLVAINARGTVTSADGVSYLTLTEPGTRHLVSVASGSPFISLNATLAAIAARYDQSTAAFVAMQLEYPWAAD
jgi:putative intracellular protease/amidase